MTLGLRAALLAVPTVLAFFTGGYADAPRAWAGLAVWIIALLALATRPLPRTRAATLAIGGALAFAVWTLVSVFWAPLAGPAWDAGQIALLYAGALIAGTLLLGSEAEAVLALGTVVVVGYGLSERLLPGLLRFTHSVSAGGRLEQPLTYWNGMGAVAAFGFVLCARLATRRPWAAAAAAPLGLGLILTVSRGALFACLAGLLVLVVTTRSRRQLAAIALVVAGTGALVAVAAPLTAVRDYTGAHAGRQGALMLAAIVLVGAVAARRARRLPDGELRLPADAGVIALVLIVAGFGLAVAVGSDERGGHLATTSGRLTSLNSNRYEYWKIAVAAFGDQPLRGVGAGGWAMRWLRERPFAEAAQDAHSLYLQTLAELGIVGLILLATAFGGVALAARASPGLAAACAVWAAHAALDWDFELPATTLPAVLAAGALLAQSASATRGASRQKTTSDTTTITA